MACGLRVHPCLGEALQESQDLTPQVVPQVDTGNPQRVPYGASPRGLRQKTQVGVIRMRQRAVLEG